MSAGWRAVGDGVGPRAAAGARRVDNARCTGRASAADAEELGRRRGGAGPKRQDRGPVCARAKSRMRQHTPAGVLMCGARARAVLVHELSCPRAAAGLLTCPTLRGGASTALQLRRPRRDCSPREAPATCPAHADPVAQTLGQLYASPAHAWKGLGAARRSHMAGTCSCKARRRHLRPDSRPLTRSFASQRRAQPPGWGPRASSGRP